ncbi:T9SS type A sorting domain-containing protein [Lentimicrobium sp. S6]|uniref:T9SS type A sorting domain-containing protein n=1 Tax=Lentimicrobium sp. S6 TaxID=2735872 RepID=UPI001552927B|nr:T9SS type A sorting domain-containing protein [Lentimicrobium sp. S6]NPD45473.1 T9SS type A sorting domain-containing protein [Lentimicrobium sp. S6]
MNKLYTFILSLIAISSTAQISPYSKVLWAAGDISTQAYSSSQSFDNKTFIIGEYFGIHKSFVMKIDDFGDPIWTKTIAQVDNNHEPRLINIISTLDSCQFILGSILNQNNSNQDAFFAKMDRNGVLLWTKTNNLGGLVNVSETADSGFILTGEHDFSSSAYKQLSVVKITKNGSLEWSRIIRFGTALSKGLSAIQNENGNFIITGHYKNENETKTTALLAELSNTGEINWCYGYKNPTLGYHYEIEDVLIYNDEYYTLMNNDMNSILMKTDSLGNVVSAKEIIGSGYYDIGYGIKRKLHINNQNELLFIHTNGIGGFIKTDLNAEAIINGNVFFPIIDIQFKEQNKLLAIGNGPLMGVKSAPPPPYETIGLIQMDDEGNGIDCTEGSYEGYSEDFELQQLSTEYIIEGGGISTNIAIEIDLIDIDQRDGCVDFIGGIENIPDNLVSVYPNPSQGIINIDFEEMIDAKLYIINPFGQIIHQETINQQQFKIDLNRFGNGVYLYHIESDKAFISSGHFILNN